MNKKLAFFCPGRHFLLLFSQIRLFLSSRRIKYQANAGVETTRSVGSSLARSFSIGNKQAAAKIAVRISFLSLAKTYQNIKFVI